MAADFSPTGSAGPARGRAGGLVLGRGARARLHAVGRLAAGRGARGRRRPPAVRARPRTASTLTPAGARLLPRAIRVLDELDAALREAAGDEVATGPVRLGAFATAAAGLVPQALASLPPELTVTLREGTTPALTRALRAGTLDLAVLAQHAAVPAAGRRVARARAHDAVRARAGRRRARRPPARERASASRSSSSRARSGSRADPTRATRCSASGRAWPSARTSATSCATGSPSCRSSPPGWRSPRSPRSPSTSLPDGVEVVAVRGEPHETRRLVLARRPGPLCRLRGRASPTRCSPPRACDHCHSDCVPRGLAHVLMR